MQECESCDGEGQFDHYGNIYKCKECRETGEIQTHMTEKVKNPNTVFRFKEMDIAIKYVYELIEVFNVVKPKIFSIVKLGASVIWFKLDSVYIGIACMYNVQEEKNKWDIINVYLK
jgi:hypothetical protein